MQQFNKTMTHASETIWKTSSVIVGNGKCKQKAVKAVWNFSKRTLTIPFYLSLSQLHTQRYW